MSNLQLVSIKELNCIAIYNYTAKWIMFITRQLVWVYIKNVLLMQVVTHKTGFLRAFI